MRLTALSHGALLALALPGLSLPVLATSVADTTPPSFVHPPVLLPAPNPEVPLAAMVGLETDEPVRVELTFFDGTTTTGPFHAEPRFRKRHARVPVVGVHPGATYRVTVTVYDQAGNATVAPAPLVFFTPPLPADFPPLETTVSVPSSMEPGVTLITPRENRNNTPWMILLDERGEVVWYYVSPAARRLGDVRRMDGGDWLAIVNRDRVVQFDMLGDVRAEWKAVGVDPTVPPGVVPVQTDGFHHEVIELPDADVADLAVLGVELRDYPNYPASETDPTQLSASTAVAGDVIVEFKRDGTIVREFKLLDLLDPYRISYDSLSGFWDPHYGQLGTADWSHANAVILDAHADAYIVSLRSQEAVVKISRQSGQVEWILGDPAGWLAPWSSKLLAMELGQPEFNWQYHQHAPELTANGNLLLFDNGNGRAVAPAPQLARDQRTSRVIELSVDESARTVRQEWTYHRNVAGEPPWYSSFLGDADRHTMTVLVTDGGKQFAGLQVGFARVVEVTYTVPPQKVFEVIVKDPAPTLPNAVSWSCYRSERLRAVYPFD